MIQTFKNKAIERLFKKNIGKGILKELEKKLRIRLEAIDAASVINDIKLPGYDLYELKGDRKGTWSIKVSGNWRITFRFEEGKVYDVDIEDYH
jgi:proteic killer suppression protein